MHRHETCVVSWFAVGAALKKSDAGWAMVVCACIYMGAWAQQEYGAPGFWGPQQQGGQLCRQCGGAPPGMLAWHPQAGCKGLAFRARATTTGDPPPPKLGTSALPVHRVTGTRDVGAAQRHVLIG